MVGPDKEEFDQALLNLFSYSVTIDFYVLSTLMENRVIGNFDGRSVVTVNSCRLWHYDIQIVQHMSKPLNFTHSLC